MRWRWRAAPTARCASTGPRCRCCAGVRELAAQGFVTGASGRNWAGYGAEVALPDGFAAVDQALLTDPQTSGGLLVSCAPAARGRGAGDLPPPRLRGRGRHRRDRRRAGRCAAAASCAEPGLLQAQQEFLHRRHRARRVFLVRHVAQVVEDDEPAAGDLLLEHAPDGGRDQPVAPAPQDQRRLLDAGDALGILAAPPSAACAAPARAGCLRAASARNSGRPVPASRGPGRRRRRQALRHQRARQHPFGDAVDHRHARRRRSPAAPIAA